jgi:multimeric flavodoxin WrbA
MNVVVFNGSPHEHGTIGAGLEIIATELEKADISTEIIHVGNMSIRGCIGCNQCRDLKLGHCVFTDDLVNKCTQKVNDADGIVLGSPVYYGGIAGTFKSFLDRLFFPGLDLKYKPALAVASCRRSGGLSTFHELNNYLNLAQALIVPSVYWNVIHGNSPQELDQDAEGLLIMRTAGRNMAWLLNTISAGKDKIPAAEPRVWTNFIR